MSHRPNVPHARRQSFLQCEHRQHESMSWHHDAPLADESEEQELRRLFEVIRAESQSRSEERSARLAHRLIRSVLPLFVMDERDHLERIGTCVMVRVDSRLFLLTAGHVLADAASRQLWAISGPKGRTIGLAVPQWLIVCGRFAR